MTTLIRRAWDLASAAGLLAGILSVALLLRQGFDLGLVPPLRIVAAWYEGAVVFLLSPLETPVNWIAAFLERWMPGVVALSPFWRHFLVSSLIIAGACWRAGRGHVYVMTGASVLFLGITVALTAGGESRSDGMAGLAVFLLLVGTVVLTVAIQAAAGWFARRVKRVEATAENTTWADVWKITASLLVVIVGGVIFLLMNAGLKLAGL